MEALKPQTAEHRRVSSKRWKRWGPYLSERAWGTVREDYSAYGNAWDYFPHDHARSRTYRWNEDGLAGISDDPYYGADKGIGSQISPSPLTNRLTI